MLRVQVGTYVRGKSTGKKGMHGEGEGKRQAVSRHCVKRKWYRASGGI